MSRSRLSLAIDGPEAGLPGGQPITGTVQVEPTSDLGCQRLHVGLGVRAVPMGEVANIVDPKQGFVDGAVLYQGPWQAGARQRYPFRLDPGACRSHDGTVLRLEYFVRASARVGGVVETVERPVRLRLAGDTGLHVRWNQADLEAGGMGCLVVGAVLTTLALLTVPVALLSSRHWILGVGIGLLFCGVVGLALNLRQWLAQRRLGHVLLSFERVAHEPGERWAGDRGIRVSIVTEPDAPVRRALAALTVREWVRRAAEGVRKWEHELYRDVVALEVTPDGRGRSGLVMLPETGRFPYNILLGEKTGGGTGKAAYEIQWEVAARVELKGAPAWERTVPLRVRPHDLPFEP